MVTEEDISFGDNQIDSFELSSNPRGDYPEQQIIIIPRREGRVFFIVSATMKFDKEKAFKSLFLTNSLDGQEDYMVSAKLFQLIGNLSFPAPTYHPRAL